MGHKKSIGLPGGPNEFLQDITQYISIEGYKNDSPDKNNPVNIIESSNITMEGVDFPVRGYGNNGVVQDMTPGAPHYDYGNADYVVEVPMAQDGGDPEMLFKDEYNTALTKEEKIEYEAWVVSESKRQNRDIMWDLGTYDIQGFWKSGDHMRMDKDNHGSDRWKKPNHPTFSDQSNYHNVNGFLGGTWAPNGAYTPAAHTRKLYDNAYYEKLFDEPGRIEHLKLEEKQKGGSALPKAQYGLKDGEGSSYKEILRNTEKSFNKWLDYSMGPINNIGQILTEDQMKKFYDFDDNIENQVANIRQEYKDENIPYGSKNWKPVNMDPRIIALRKEQADWEAANPIYQETRDLINEGLDPLRHSSSSAKTSKALQQKVRDVPYIGGLLDFLGVDKAVGFVGANALGIGHEAMTIKDDKRDWTTKLNEAGQDIYNNFKGSLEGNKNLNERETLNNLLDQYKLGNLADGTVMPNAQEFVPKPIKRLTQADQEMQFDVDPMQEGGCTSCTESMRQREGSYNKGKEYILDPRFKQEGGSTTNQYTIYMNYINGIDESEVAQNIFDKLNRMHYRDAKTRGMGVANYIASNIIPNS